MRRLLTAVRLNVVIEKPEAKWRAAAFTLVRHRYFDPFIVGCIIVNALIMMMEHYEQSQECVHALNLLLAALAYMCIRAARACVRACD
jgi:hypothetical protein